MLMTKTTLVGLQNCCIHREVHCVTTFSSHPCSFWLEGCAAPEHQKLRDGTGGGHGLCLCHSSSKHPLLAAIQILSIVTKWVLHLIRCACYMHYVCILCVNFKFPRQVWQVCPALTAAIFTLLALDGFELIFFIAAYTELCLGLVTKTKLTTHQYFGCCSAEHPQRQDLLCFSPCPLCQ